jgi:putative addiction module killer protein
LTPCHLNGALISDGAKKIDVRELLVNGASPYAKWLRKLSPSAQAKVLDRVNQIEQTGNLGMTRNLRFGLIELKFGSTTWVYGGREGDKLFLIALGGDKRRQSEDIEYAEAIWLAYTKSKERE